MTRLRFDPSKEGILSILKPWQIVVMHHLWNTQKPLTSRETQLYLKEIGGEAARSIAPITNFLNHMVDEGLLDYVVERCKGGYHRVYALNDKSRTEQIFRETVYSMLVERLSVCMLEEAEG